MAINERISINEIDGKRYQIRLVEPADHRKAIITHYLHNKDNGVAKYFEKDAKR